MDENSKLPILFPAREVMMESDGWCRLWTTSRRRSVTGFGEIRFAVGKASLRDLIDVLWNGGACADYELHLGRLRPEWE